MNSEFGREAFGIERLGVVGDRGMISQKAIDEMAQATLLLATEQNLQKIKVRVDAARLAGKDKVGVAVDKCVNQYQVAKHFELVITDNAFTFGS